MAWPSRRQLVALHCDRRRRLEPSDPISDVESLTHRGAKTRAGHIEQSISEAPASIALSGRRLYQGALFPIRPLSRANIRRHARMSANGDTANVKGALVVTRWLVCLAAKAK